MHPLLNTSFLSIQERLKSLLQTYEYESQKKKTDVLISELY